MTFKFEASGEEGVLTIDGEISIRCAGELKNALTEALERTNRLFLDFQAVSGMDVTCMQLICSAHRMTFLTKKHMILKGELSDTCRRIVEASGFARKTCCRPDQDQLCFWAKKGEL